MSVPAFTLSSLPSADALVRVQLAGQVTLVDGAALWQGLRAILRSGAAVEIDLGGVGRLDGGAAALFTACVAEHAERGGSVQLRGASVEVQRLLTLYACSTKACAERAAPREPGLLQDVGSFAYDVASDTRTIFAFVGDLAVGALRAVRAPRTVHLAELGSLIERAGADGVAIVVLINFLVGAILGLQGAIQLHRFGGDQFLANLVGLSVVRELGPLMTAILVAGRSGAAYAAELGTMTVNEEVDALRTLGQDPQRFLVFPRVLTLALVVPVLTLLGDVFGALGGLAIAVGYLDQPSVVYVQGLERAIGFSDVATGVLKSVAFAAAIGLISCQRGLSTRGGAAGVGNSTTSAVVVVLFSLVALDAVATWIFSLLDW
jgi:phospholipid/cholesterol/gamma-HCH transport system permease protein